MNNYSGATSTVEPTGTSTSEFTTSPDNYVWKYMYTLSTTQITNFMTTDFIAVTTDSTVAAAAVKGVGQYIVANGGAGYTNGTYSTQTLRGDGTGGTFTVVVASGAVSTVTAVAVGGGSTQAAQYHLLIVTLMPFLVLEHRVLQR